MIGIVSAPATLSLAKSINRKTAKTVAGRSRAIHSVERISITLQERRIEGFREKRIQIRYDIKITPGLKQIHTYANWAESI